MKTVAANIEVRGRVQGVSFRYHTRQKATGLGLSGWVKNRPDGSVAVRVEGPEPQVRQLIAWLRQGPSAARVDALDIAWLEPSGAGGSFEIRF